MDTEKSDQQIFDEQVDRAGRVIVQAVTGLGIVAALVLSSVALVQSSDRTTAPRAVAVSAATAPAVPMRAQVVIEHVTRGCHAMLVDGGAPTPTATVRLAAGGRLDVTDDDVMPHQLRELSGPAANLTGAAMNHMGAQSSVTFPVAGTYALTTKAGEDYSAGIKTIGPDNTLRLRVVVTS